MKDVYIVQMHLFPPYILCFTFYCHENIRSCQKNNWAVHGTVIFTGIVTARKRSLGQGNVFTGVCLSTGGWLPSMRHRSHSQGVYPPPPESRHPPHGDRSPGCRHPPGIRSTSGLYASYWNANLFCQLSL